MDVNALAQAMKARFGTEYGGLTLTQTRAAVTRAIQGYAQGRAMTNAPNDPRAGILRNLPNVPVLDRRRGDIEYQVVLVVRDGNSVVDFGFTYQMRRRETADQLLARAMADYYQVTVNEQRYLKDTSKLGPALQFSIVVTSATNYRPSKASG